MYFKIQVVIDAAEPAKLAEFWALALDYVLEPPPHGFETWEDFGRSIGMPEEKFGDQAAVIDPADEGPRLYFQRVPERKTVKNRVHWDVRLAGADKDSVRATLVARGATFLWTANQGPHSWHTMADPEGNEFCIS